MVRPQVLLMLAIALTGSGLRAEELPGWISLFNGKDTSGWKLRQDKILVARYFDAAGQPLPDAKLVRVETRDRVVDGKDRPIPGARVATINGRAFAVDAEGRLIKGARLRQLGGRYTIVGPDGLEIPGARRTTERVDNVSGWKVADGVLLCARPHKGNDLVTEQRFTDFALHFEFQALGNSGVFLQGRYEIQVVNSVGAKPKVVKKDGQWVHVLDSRQCGAICGKRAPSKNMARSPREWQSFDVVFHGARGAPGQLTQRARVTLSWNGETVIDNAEIDGPTLAALDGHVTEPGPLLLQGDYGRVAFRNIRIRRLD